MTDTTDQSKESNSERSDLLTFYDVMFETLRHEGNGIWERFNILVAFNLALFAAVGVLCVGDWRPVFWRGFSIVTSVGGLLATVWSIYVLRRLWERHWHWRQTLEKIEEQFPPGWPRALDKGRQSLVPLTEPYLLILAAAWVVLLTLLAACPTAFGSAPGAN